MFVKDPEITALGREFYCIDDRGMGLFYLVAGEDRAALIDAGSGTTDIAGLVRNLTDKPVAVFLTHAHPDHAIGAGQFEEILVDEAEADMLSYYLLPPVRRAFWNSIRDGVPDYRSVILRTVRREIPAEQEGNVSSFAEESFGASPRIRFLSELRTDIPTEAPPEALAKANAESPLSRYGRYDLGGRSLTVIPTPGHSPGSVCYLLEPDGVLFSGDTVLAGSHMLNFPESASIEVYRESLFRLVSLAGRIREVCSGHRMSPLTPDAIRELYEGVLDILDGQIPASRENTFAGDADIYRFFRNSVILPPAPNSVRRQETTLTGCPAL